VETLRQNSPLSSVRDDLVHPFIHSSSHSSSVSASCDLMTVCYQYYYCHYHFLRDTDRREM
jgi:hypothetical protein